MLYPNPMVREDMIAILKKGEYDYPIYVRWTEKRNMEAFLDLLSDKKNQP